MYGADSLPGNAAGIELPPLNEGYIAGGDSPGRDQLAHARGAFGAGLLAGAVPQGRPAGATDDVPSPQQFPDRPSLAELLAATDVGDDTATQQLPGRIYPAAWDGEPGFDAPGGAYA